jgi:murein DD-endopeptidase MepM/ murein hydrolase activator NlpD
VEIFIDGEPALVVQSREVAEKVLATVKGTYRAKLAGEKVEEIRFREKVTLHPRQVAVSEITPPDAAVSLLQQGRVQTKKYIVKDGDSLWSIARAHDLLVDDLYRANPELTSDRLDIDQELKLAASEPLINVMITSTAVKKEAIPFEVRVEYDSGLWRGQTRVRRAGEEGEVEVTYRVVRQNETTVSREVLGRRVLKEPVSKVVAQGTRRTVAVAQVSRGSGSGTLSWPVGGSITSGYGYRGREFHGGIDIAAGSGTPVGAAAGGRVVSAGWDGGYGQAVVIDHGNGLATRYAHLSRISVSSGETVSRGEVIGTVGSTGRASGPHLHFEVLVNGSRTNPYNYLR